MIKFENFKLIFLRISSYKYLLIVKQVSGVYDLDKQTNQQDTEWQTAMAEDLKLSSCLNSPKFPTFLPEHAYGVVWLSRGSICI